MKVMSRTRIAVSAAVSLVLVGALLSTGAEAKTFKTKVSATIFGLITPDATVKYALTGQVEAGFAFGCMEGRQVTLIKVGPNRKPKRIVGTETKFFGKFTAVIDKRLSALPGYYYVKAKPRVRHMRHHRTLRCLAGRTSTFLVEVPDELLLATAPWP
jgi:hypothetical protein